jgi:hypothetical protein
LGQLLFFDNDDSNFTPSKKNAPGGAFEQLVQAPRGVRTIPIRRR